ncbi:MAG: hypothetical protein VX278_04500, partial [Myxococcota bacterium]|nr:hypothetical protein [Myxococcota bacterium]
MQETLIQDFETLSSHPHARLVIQGERGWFVLQRYTNPYQALCEAASDPYLPKENPLTPEQKQLLLNEGYKKRRKGRSLGKIVALNTPELRETLYQELSSLFDLVYQESIEDARVHTQFNVLSKLNNQSLLNTMKKLSTKRTHELRLTLYHQLVQSKLLLAIQSDGLPRAIDTIAGLPSYAAFTDDSAIRFWDPRGCEYKILEGYDLFL